MGQTDRNGPDDRHGFWQGIRCRAIPMTERPSHSDDLCNVLEPIGLDTTSVSTNP